MPAAQDLFNALKSNPTVKGLPDATTFEKALQNPEKAGQIYDMLSKNPTIKGLPSKDVFINKFSPKQPTTQPVRQEVPASIAKPVPMQAQPQKPSASVGERIVQAEVGKAQLEQPQVEPQPKQPTIMQGFRDISKPVQADRVETIPQPKQPTQAPSTWQQATDIAVTETNPDITFEQFQQKRQEQQSFSLAGMLKSDKQKAFEQENEMLKRYADVYDFNAQQAAQNFQTRFGLSINNAESLEAAVQPFFTKQNQIDAELKGFETQWQEASEIPDEAARTAAQDRIKAQFNVKVGELNDLEAQYKDKLDAYRFYAASPEFSIYKDLKGKSTEAKNRRAQLPLDERYKDITQDIGELEGLANAYTRGMQNAEIADILAAGRQPTTEELRRIAQLKREQEGYKVSDAVERFNNASGFKESAKAFLSNPFEITSQWVTESLVAQMSHGLTRAGAGTLTGAAIGSVIPGIGTAAGAGTGFIAGMGMAGFNLEYSSSILESLQEAGIDIANEDSLVNGFSDASKMKQAKEFALKRGVPIAVFDMVTGGIGSKIAKAPIKSALKKGVAEFGTEMVGAGGGEVAAQLISKGEISGKEVFAEIIGEIGAGAPTVAVNNLVALKEKASKLKGKEKTDVEAQIVQEAVNTDVPVETFNEVVNLHEGAGLIEPQAADELKSQYEQAQANKPVKTMQDELQVGDTVEMSPEVTKPTEVVAEGQAITEPINTQENAIQEQTADEGVLRQERPEVGLQEVEQGNAQQEGIAQEGQVQEEITPVTDEKAKETRQEPMLGQLPTDRDEAKAGQESAELRTQAQEEVAETVSEIVPPVVEQTTVDGGGVTSPNVSESPLTYTESDIKNQGYNVVDKVTPKGADGMLTLKQQQDLEAGGLNMKDVVFFSAKDGDVFVAQKAAPTNDQSPLSSVEATAKALAKDIKENLDYKDSEIKKLEKAKQRAIENGKNEIAQSYQSQIDFYKNIDESDFIRHFIKNPKYYTESNIDPFLRYSNREVNLSGVDFPLIKDIKEKSDIKTTDVSPELVKAVEELLGKPQAEKGVGETVQQGAAATRPTATERTATDVEAIFESVAQAYADMKEMKPKDARAKKAEIKEMLKANPKADFIFTNWNKLKKQLKFTTKGDCP